MPNTILRVVAWLLYLEAVAKHMSRGRVARFERRPA